MKNIYLLYKCDAWKYYNSRHLVIATTSERKLRKKIKEQIKGKFMEYSSDRDIKDQELDDIDRNLAYGQIVVLEDGEGE